MRRPRKAGDLQPSSANPRTVTDNALAELGRSMREFGDISAIVFNRRTGRLVGGHQRRKHLPDDAPVTRLREFKKPTAAGTLALGTVELDGEVFLYREVDWPADKEAAANLRANNAAGEWDEDVLAAVLAQMMATGYDLHLTGFDDARIAGLIASTTVLPPDSFDPTPPARARSKVGKLYELGPHRLVCGDSTDAAVIAAVAGGGVARMLWTDPPYGVEYVGGTAERLTIGNDAPSDTYGLLRAALAAARQHLEPSSPFYIAAPAGPQGTVFRRALEDEGWRFHQALVWLKDRFVLGHSDYHYKHEDVLFGAAPGDEPPRPFIDPRADFDRDHEDVLYGHVPGDGRPGRGRHKGTRWLGGNSASSVMEVPRPTRSKEHPTMKPVELVVRHIHCSAPVGDAVLDIFGGSGTTLIACEATGRRAMIVERDPRYCDVIRKRYAEFVSRPDLMP